MALTGTAGDRDHATAHDCSVIERYAEGTTQYGYRWAERYERRGVVLTSNLVFSDWDRIFKDPLTTAAAIDRLVHHSVILEFGADIPSRRAEAAARRQKDASADGG